MKDIKQRYHTWSKVGKDTLFPFLQRRGGLWEMNVLKSLFFPVLQCCALFNRMNFPLFSGPDPVSVNWNFIVILPCFTIFKNVVHILEVGETHNFSASHQALNYLQRSSISKETLSKSVLWRFGSGYFFQFTNVLKFSTVYLFLTF